MLFIDGIANVCGFYLLYGHTVHKRNYSPSIGFRLTSVASSLQLLLRVNQTKLSRNAYIMKTRSLCCESPLDYCLLAVCAHESRSAKYMKTYECSASRSYNEDRLSLSPDDTLENWLLKSSVNMFTKYYKLRCNAMRLVEPKCGCEIVSHFEALYHYRNHEYTQVLKTCDRIISQESCMRGTPDGTQSHLIQSYNGIQFPNIPVVFTLQVFFGNDVTCLNGLIALIDRKLMSLDDGCKNSVTFGIKMSEALNKTKDSQKGTAVDDHIVNEYLVKYELGRLAGYQPIFNWAKVSSVFLVFYLRLESMKQLSHRKSDILSALNVMKQVKTGFLFEDVLMLFMARKLERHRTVSHIAISDR